MGIQYNPRISTDGLVLALDAANPKSYPGSGTIWTDLSGRGNTGTLTNGPTYSSLNSGSIVFDGSNDYVNFSNIFNFTVGSISVWFKTSNAGSSYRALINKSESWGLFLKDNVLITYDWGNGADRTTGLNVATNTWQNATMTFTETIGTPSNNAIIYLNGNPVLTTTVKWSAFLAFQISAQNGGQNFSGNIAQASVYNRALTATEVSQNFNALRSRFSI
jgi:hypothetical protein